MEIYLRIAGIALSAMGAIILAWRVRGILNTMVTAQEANDLNFRIMMEILSGQPQRVPLIVGMNEQVTRKQKRGVWLLVIGFVCIAIGNALVGASWYIAAA